LARGLWNPSGVLHSVGLSAPGDKRAPPGDTSAPGDEDERAKVAPDRRSVRDIVVGAGYPFEQHEIVTTDGYGTLGVVAARVRARA
jgi:hypothetical protein